MGINIDERFVVLLYDTSFRKLDSQVYPKRYLFLDVDDVMDNHRALLPHIFTKKEMITTIARCLKNHPAYKTELEVFVHFYGLDRNSINEVLKRLGLDG